MRAAKVCTWISLTAMVCSGCSHKSSSPPQQAQAPPLQTGKGTLSTATTTPPQEKTESPLASPLPQTPAPAVTLPPPTPKKVRHKSKTPPAKAPDTTQTASNAQAPPPAPAPAPAHVSPTAAGTAASPIGQLTAGDSATEERAKKETVDLIANTQQGLGTIKRNLSNEEKVTATQIRTFLKQAQQALDNGDTQGAHGLAVKAKQLLDELTQP
jgi:outer membrane biosynthesis protein TonB